MCGIAGLWRFGGAEESRLGEELRSMTEAIAYRGPDGEGHWIDGVGGVALGHRRLAIVDLSPTGYQPMTSADGRVVITYNGELFNTAEIAAELAMPLRGTSDTEVLVEAIARFGIDGALRRTNGLFAFAAYDRNSATLHLARDHLGIKPLYYTRQHGAFAFASEMKALRALRDLTFTLDPTAVGAYLRHACVPAPKSIFREVAKLMPSERIEVTAEGIRRHSYWDLAAVANARQVDMTHASFDDVVDQLDELLRDAVKRQLVSDVPLGSFLSGGIDSSVVTALMRAVTNGPVKTFSIGFSEKAFNEADHARAVAKHLGTDHTEVIFSAADALALIPQIPSIYDEPFADSSQLPTYLVSRLARSKVTVALSGDGGDETFGGYVRYRGVRNLWATMSYLPASMRRSGASAIRWLSAESLDSLASLVPRKYRPTHFGDKLLKGANLLDALDQIEMYQRLISVWPDPEKLMVDGDKSAGWIERFAPAAVGLPTVAQLRLLDMLGYLPDDILTKVDRAAMAVSLEVRVPLLDHRVVAFAWGLPEHYLIGAGKGKRPLRALLGRYLPTKMFERPKMGFGVPIGEWLRGPLRHWAEDLLSPTALAEHGLFEQNLLRLRWEEHLSGRRNWQHALWSVLQFQAWRRANP